MFLHTSFPGWSERKNLFSPSNKSRMSREKEHLWIPGRCTDFSRFRGDDHDARENNASVKQKRMKEKGKCLLLLWICSGKEEEMHVSVLFLFLWGKEWRACGKKKEEKEATNITHTQRFATMSTYIEVATGKEERRGKLHTRYSLLPRSERKRKRKKLSVSFLFSELGIDFSKETRGIVRFFFFFFCVVWGKKARFAPRTIKYRICGKERERKVPDFQGRISQNLHWN